MTSAMMFDRAKAMNEMCQMPMMGGMSMMPSMSMMMPGMGMVPRCTMKMEKCAGGMKMTCICEDEMSAATLQNLCKMMAGGMCSIGCMMNGMMMCQCNMCMCKCTCTDCEGGVCITCTSGDKACCEMIQACCDCLCACMKAGCMCCVCMGNTPVCCCSCC